MIKTKKLSTQKSSVTATSSSKILRLCKKIIIILLILGLIAIAGMVGWLSSAPREIAPLKNILSSHIANRVGASKVEMENPTLFINLQNHTVELEISGFDATLASANVRAKGAIIQAKTTKIAVNIVSLLKLQPAYSDLEIRSFNLILPNDTNSEAKKTLHIPEVSLRPNAENHHKNHLEITLSSVEKTPKPSSDGVISSKLVSDGVISSSEQSITKYAGKIIADITFNPKTIVVNASVDNVPASLLQIVTPDIGEINADMNATIEAVFKRNLQMIFAHGKLDIEKLQLNHADFYPDKKTPLKLQNIKADIEWERDKQFLLLHDLQAKSDDITLDLQGKILPDFSQAELHAKVAHMQVRDLVGLWPKKVANEARTWVDEHILAGVIDDATILINHDATTKANILLHVSDAEIEYAKHLPKAFAANGEIKITENSLAINVHSAKSLGSINIKDGFAEIPSFTDAAVPMRFKLPIMADAKDVAIFLSKPHLNKAVELLLQKDAIQGKIDGILTLDFPLYPERAGLGKSSFDNLFFTIKAKITGLSQNNLFGNWDLEDFSGVLDMDNNQVTTDAKGVLNHALAKLKIKHIFAKKSTNYQFDLHLNDKQFTDFDIRLPAKLVQGNVVINGVMQQNNAIKNIEAMIDMGDAKIDLSQYGWSKKRGKPAILKIKENYNGKVKNVEILHLQAGDEEVKGSLMMNENGEIANIELPLVRTHHADLAMKYVNATRPELTLKGDKLDISWLQPKVDDEGEAKAKTANLAMNKPTNKPIYYQNHLNHLMNKIINIELKQLITVDKTLRDFALKTNCAVDYCESADMSANYDKDNKIMANISYLANGKRGFTLQADNFGSVMKAISGNNNFRGGVFSVHGAFDDAKPNKPLIGRMILQNVKIVGAPILTRLLTLASFTGIADALMGVGIGFDKISADINYDNERIIFAKGAAKGDSLGIMFEGMLQPFGWQKQQLKGTVIPSYALNSLPSKVPLLGLLIGDEGEGVFATRFSVDGTLSEPDVMVNPLSMITPGLLRNIFEIFPDVNSHDEMKKDGDVKNNAAYKK